MSPQVLVCRVATRHVATLLAAKGFCLAMTAAFGVGGTGLDVAACHKGAQDAFAHVGLHLGNCRLIKSSRRVKSHTVWLRLKHPINHAHMKKAKRSFVSQRRKGYDRQNAHACSGWSHNEVAVQTNLYSSSDFLIRTEPIWHGESLVVTLWEGWQARIRSCRRSYKCQSYS